MDENRRPGTAGVDNNNNNNNELYGNGIRNTHNYVMDNYNDNFNYNNDRSTNNGTGSITSSSNGKNNGSPHIDFKALAKSQKKKKSRGMNGSSAVLATRHHNVVDAVDFERNGGVQDGGRAEERSDKHNNLLGVESQRLQLISPPPEEMLRRVSGSSGVSMLSVSLCEGLSIFDSAAKDECQRTVHTFVARQSIP